MAVDFAHKDRRTAAELAPNQEPTSEAMTTRKEIPLFPLGNVLFSGGRMPLRIFEPRYLDLVGRCMKTQSGFGVVLIREGVEARRRKDERPPTLFEVGTYARIADFNQLSNGMLGVVCAGKGKFRIHRSWQAADHLTLAEVEFLPEEPAAPMPEEFESLIATLRMLVAHPLVRKLGAEVDYEDARSVGWRLAELLPVDAETKQGMLEMQDPMARLEALKDILAKLSS